MKKVEDKGFRIMKYFDNDGGTWDLEPSPDWVTK
jgi:hypothetical protein